MPKLHPLVMNSWKFLLVKKSQPSNKTNKSLFLSFVAVYLLFMLLLFVVTTSCQKLQEFDNRVYDTSAVFIRHLIFI